MYNMRKSILTLTAILSGVILISSCSSKSVAETRNEERLAEKYNGLGNQYFHQKKYMKALEYYDEAIKIDERSLYQYNKGRAAQISTAYDDAIKAYKSAIGRKKDYKEAWYYLALAYESIGEKENSQGAFKEYQTLIERKR